MSDPNEIQLPPKPNHRSSPIRKSDLKRVARHNVEARHIVGTNTFEVYLLEEGGDRLLGFIARGGNERWRAQTPIDVPVEVADPPTRATAINALLQYYMQERELADNPPVETQAVHRQTTPLMVRVDVGVGEIAQVLAGNDWKSVSDDSRSRYIEEAKRMLEHFEVKRKE